MALFEIKDLTFTYPDAKSPALSNININIKEGELYLVVGKSGCGKTTFIRHLKTVLRPYGNREGQILFNGKSVEEMTLREQAEKIGYVFQSPDHQIVTDKVWHELAFGIENLGYDQSTIRLRVAEMASYFGISSWFDKNVEELSGGQKQILNLASVMAMQPDVLVLDEPTSQLDPIAASDFLNTVKKINRDLGVTVVMIEHRLEEAFPMADKVLVLEEGKVLYYDTPRNVGTFVKDNELNKAMPSSVQIYNSTGQKGSCPLTIREGRNYLKDYFCYSDNSKSMGNVPKRNIQNENNYIKGEKDKKGKLDEIAIEGKDLWFTYNRFDKDVIKDLSFKIKRGELYAILGGNGTGKTTTLSLLSGLNKPYRGKIKYKDKTRSRLGVLPQNPQTLFSMETVEEDLMFVVKEHKIEKEILEKIIDDTNIRHLLKMHPYDLSGGEQQRAALAKVLLTLPDILLLDEPTKGMDGFYKECLGEIFKKLCEEGKTIIMVSHDIEFCAQFADRCALFFNGTIITENEPDKFFTGNSFYTTSANRMSRGILKDAVTVKDVIDICMG